MTVEKLEINVTTKTNGSETKIKNLADALEKLEAKASAMTGISNLSALASAMSSISSVSIDTKAFSGLARGIDKLTESLRVIDSNDIANLAVLAKALERIKGVNLAGLGNVSNISKAANSLHQTSRGINSVSKAASKAKGPLSTFVASLKRIAFYRTVRTAIKELSQAFTEGLKNAYLFSAGLESVTGHRFAAAMDNMNSKLTQMKAQMGSALISLLTALEPVITRLVSLITRAADAVSQLISAFTGRTYLRTAEVTDTLVDDFQSGAKAAKEWKNQLLGFDVINRLEDNNSGGGVSPAEMFGGKETLIDERFLNLANRIKEAIGRIDFSEIITSLRKVRGLIEEIRGSFSTAFSGSDGPDTVGKIFSILSRTVAITGNLANSFRRAWNENDRGATILHGVFEIVQSILDCFIDISSSVAEWADTLDFGLILDSFDNMLEKLQPLVDMISGGLRWAFDYVLEPLGKWVLEEAGPASVDALTAAIELLTSVLSPLWEGFTKAWSHIRPIVEWFGGLIVETLSTVTVEIERFAQMFSDKSGEIQSIVESLGRGIGLIWNVELRPLLDLIKNVFFGTFQSVMSIIRISARIILTVIGSLCNAINRIAEGDWKGAWDALKGTATKVWDDLIAELPNLFEGIKNIINGFLKGINNVLEWIGITPIPLLGNTFSGQSMGSLFGESTQNIGSNNYASGNLGGVVSSFGSTSSDLYKSMSDANQDVVSAILAGATQVVSAVNDKDTDITLDGDSVARKLYRPLQSAGKIVGSSLIEGVH